MAIVLSRVAGGFGGSPRINQLRRFLAMGPETQSTFCPFCCAFAFFRAPWPFTSFWPIQGLAVRQKRRREPQKAPGLREKLGRQAPFVCMRNTNSLLASPLLLRISQWIKNHAVSPILDEVKRNMKPMTTSLAPKAWRLLLPSQDAWRRLRKTLLGFFRW